MATTTTATSRGMISAAQLQNKMGTSDLLARVNTSNDVMKRSAAQLSQRVNPHGVTVWTLGLRIDKEGFATKKINKGYWITTMLGRSNQSSEGHLMPVLKTKGGPTTTNGTTAAATTATDEAASSKKEYKERELQEEQHVLPNFSEMRFSVFSQPSGEAGKLMSVGGCFYDGDKDYMNASNFEISSNYRDSDLIRLFMETGFANTHVTKEIEAEGFGNEEHIWVIEPRKGANTPLDELSLVPYPGVDNVAIMWATNAMSFIYKNEQQKIEKASLSLTLVGTPIPMSTDGLVGDIAKPMIKYVNARVDELAKFKFSTVARWHLFAPLVLPLCTIAFCCRVNYGQTAKQAVNKSQETEIHSVTNFFTDAVIFDHFESYRRITIPVTFALVSGGGSYVRVQVEKEDELNYPRLPAVKIEKDTAFFLEDLTEGNWTILKKREKAGTEVAEYRAMLALPLPTNGVLLEMLQHNLIAPELGDQYITELLTPGAPSDWRRELPGLRELPGRPSNVRDEDILVSMMAFYENRRPPQNATPLQLFFGMTTPPAAATEDNKKQKTFDGSLL